MFVTSRTQITNSSYCFTSILSRHRSHKACGHTFRFELDLSAVTDTQDIPSHQGFHQQTRIHSLQVGVLRPPPFLPKTEAINYERDD